MFGTKVNKKIVSLLKLFNGKNILDLGCAYGANALYLASKGFNVIAVDYDEKALSFLQNKAINANVSIKVKNVRIEKYKFSDKNFSLILALNVLHFFEFKIILDLINKIEKSLAKNGILYARVFSLNDPSCKIIARKTSPVENNTFFSTKTGRFYHYFSIQELKDILKRFKILEISEFFVDDNHVPDGYHKHCVIDIIAKRR